jgi:hypothetical protein
VIAYDLEADFDTVRAAGRTSDPPPLQANPDPQEIGILLLSWAMHELLGADGNGGCGVPHRQCHACDLAWAGDAVCWLCGREPERHRLTGWGLASIPRA